MASKKTIKSAIESMMSSIGDDYTNYTDDDVNENPLEKLEGSYEGIGLSVSTTMDKEIIVASVFEEGPAAKAGIEINDIIFTLSFAPTTLLSVQSNIGINRFSVIHITFLKLYNSVNLP